MPQQEQTAAVRDTATAYRETRLTGAGDLPAYEAALKVYLGHHPTVSDGVARQAVSEIIAEDSQARERSR